MRSGGCQRNREFRPLYRCCLLLYRRAVRPLNESQFCVDVYQNKYLPEGAQEVNAVFTVTSAADLAQADHTDAPASSPGGADAALGGFLQAARTGTTR
jgi:hypothetical protein